jgi:hypothetical protein
MKPSRLCSLLLLVLPGGGEPVAVDFATLSDFTYTKGMELPAKVTKYDEQEIVISGFMRREADGSGQVEYFMLINGACDCDGRPKLNEILFCAMPQGETTEILSGTVKLTGTLFVGEEEEDGEVIALYSMDVDKIEQR